MKLTRKDLEFLKEKLPELLKETEKYTSKIQTPHIQRYVDGREDLIRDIQKLIDEIDGSYQQFTATAIENRRPVDMRQRITAVINTIHEGTALLLNGKEKYAVKIVRKNSTPVLIDMIPIEETQKTYKDEYLYRLQQNAIQEGIYYKEPTEFPKFIKREQCNWFFTHDVKIFDSVYAMDGYMQKKDFNNVDHIYEPEMDI